MKPILFNGEMVRAILDGRKTQTRRINKDGGEESMPDMSLFDAEARTYGVHHYQAPGYDFRNKIACVEAPVPICPGDILYVRETWAKISDWSEVDPAVGIPDGFIYRADWPDGEDGPKWHPSIHMPKEAARIFLRVTDVRVERLWDIQPADICAEGVPIGANDSADAAYESFSALWDSTIKPADRDRFGWEANPWVFVYTFDRIEKGE